MSFFKTMDLYKGIVLVSVLLIPAVGWWVMGLDEEIAACEKAIRDAKKPGGLLESIGSLQKKIELVAQNRRSTSDAIKDPRTYFEGQILAAGTGLEANDFSPKAPKEETATTGSARQRAADFVVDIDWRRDLNVQMGFVYAVLFNCESGARAGDQGGQPSVWKLRELSLVNATDDRQIAANKVPEPELLDQWLIKSMKFARREPRKGR
jgi:hypothetical protein